MFTTKFSSLFGAVIAFFALSLVARAVDIGPMTWTPRADWINVKSPSTTVPSLTLAATGNGTTDDTAAIEAIFNYVCTHSNGPNVTIYFPAGTYKITSTITMSQQTSGLSVIGCGSNTIISWAGPTGGAMYASNGEDNSRYVGLVWEGNNTAAVAYECDPQTVYQGGIRHENESFRDINAAATYSYRSDGNGNFITTPVPPTAAIVSGYTTNPPSYVGETQVWELPVFQLHAGHRRGVEHRQFLLLVLRRLRIRQLRHRHQSLHQRRQRHHELPFLQLHQRGYPGRRRHPHPPLHLDWRPLLLL